MSYRKRRWLSSCFQLQSDLKQMKSPRYSVWQLKILSVGYVGILSTQRFQGRPTGGNHGAKSHCRKPATIYRCDHAL